VNDTDSRSSHTSLSFVVAWGRLAFSRSPPLREDLQVNAFVTVPAWRTKKRRSRDWFDGVEGRRVRKARDGSNESTVGRRLLSDRMAAIRNSISSTSRVNGSRTCIDLMREIRRDRASPSYRALSEFHTSLTTYNYLGINFLRYGGQKRWSTLLLAALLNK